MDYSIETKVTRIEGDGVIVKATLKLDNGLTFTAHGTGVIGRHITGAIEIAEDIAVDRVKKLVGIKDNE